MGTTRSLHCVYVKPAFEGEMVRVECQVCPFLSCCSVHGGHGMLTSSTKIVHAGKRLCLLTGIMKREKDGQVVATCEHNKYNIDIEESKM